MEAATTASLRLVTFQYRAGDGASTWPRDVEPPLAFGHVTDTIGSQIKFGVRQVEDGFIAAHCGGILPKGLRPILDRGSTILNVQCGSICFNVGPSPRDPEAECLPEAVSYSYWSIDFRTLRNRLKLCKQKGNFHPLKHLQVLQVHQSEYTCYVCPL